MTPRRVIGVALVAAAATAGGVWAQSLTDLFADRSTLTTASGEVIGDNAGASLESEEPRHADRPGGSSVWISWRAPADGIATFSTDGSGFDTLLAAYYFAHPEDTTLNKLKESARNDDDPARPPTSLIQIGARAGVVYHIAVDGYRGATGAIRLRWDFVTAGAPPPIIVSFPQDRAARQGDTVTLTVEMEVSPDLELEWRFNGGSFDAQGPSLVIPSLQPETVGLYSLRIRLDDLRFETPAVEVQINSEGQTNALARDKLFDALESPLTPDDDDDDDDGGDDPGDDGRAGRIGLMGMGPAANLGLSRGYNGTQVFNTTFATTDPDEPDHCGSPSGATYWFAYEPPADGMLEVDTSGSTFPTLLAAYTYSPPLTSYAGLVPVACAHPAASGVARIEFAAARTRALFVVVASPTAARGIAHLNYRLDTNRAPVAPLLPTTPTNDEVALGAPLILDSRATGTPPLTFAWFKDGVLLAGQSNAVFALAAAALADSGDYQVQVANPYGQSLSPFMRVRVLVPPRLQLHVVGGFDVLSFHSLAGHVYDLEFRDTLGAAPWAPTGEPMTGTGAVLDFRVPQAGAAASFFRVRVR